MLIICLLAGAAYGIYYFVFMPQAVVEQEPDEPVMEDTMTVQPPSDSATLEGDMLALPDETNAHHAEMEREIIADPRVVGRWHERDYPTHYRVYYDDACDEHGFFWGKEWNEDDDVMEEDLIYHGNGWFKWRIEKKHFVEIHIDDQNNIQVPIEIAYANLTDTTLNLYNGSIQYLFQRIPD